jgi:hypothetical protein
MAARFSDHEFKAVLAEVEKDLTDLTAAELSKAERLQAVAPSGKAGAPEKDRLKAVQPTAAKAETPMSKDDEDPKKSPSPAESSPGLSATPGGESAPVAGDPGAEAPDADAGSTLADPAAGGEQPVSVEALEAEYEQLPPEELKMHLAAAHAAAMKVLGGAMGPDAGAGAPPGAPPPGAGPSAPPPASPPPGKMAFNEVPAAKAEIRHGDGSGGKELPVKKSEEPKTSTEVAAVRADVASLKEDVQNLVKAFEVSLGKPIRKAVTDVNFIPKAPEGDAKPVSSTVIGAHFAELTRPGSRAVKADGQPLSKADRERINAWYDNRISYDGIQDLLPRETRQ